MALESRLTSIRSSSAGSTSCCTGWSGTSITTSKARLLSNQLTASWALTTTSRRSVGVRVIVSVDDSICESLRRSSTRASSR